MAHNIVIRDPVPSDIDTLLADLRKADYEELTAVHGSDIRSAIYNAVCVSTVVFAALEDGILLGLFGCAPLAAMSGIGSPWFLGTNAVSRRPKVMCMYARALIVLTRREYRQLVNYVDARHLTNIKFLKWLGFKVYKPEPYGCEGQLFHKFEMFR